MTEDDLLDADVKPAPEEVDEAATEEEPEYARVLREMVEDKQSQIPVTAYPLHTTEGRERFLNQFAYVGTGSIFAAVSHVWKWLAPPRRANSIEIGMAAGTGGAGREAIRRVLMQFFEEIMAVEFQPIPPCSNYPTLDEWNVAAMATFTDCEKREQEVVQRYSKILNGGVP